MKLRTLFPVILSLILSLFLAAPPLFADTSVGGRIAADTKAETI